MSRLDGNELRVIKTANADNPAARGLGALLTIDVYERRALRSNLQPILQEFTRRGSLHSPSSANAGHGDGELNTWTS